MPKQATTTGEVPHGREYDALRSLSTNSYSLGNLRVAAEEAIAAGQSTVTVDAATLLALCRSEAWAHREVVARANGSN